VSNFNPLYRRFIDESNKVTPNQMVRGNFYIIKEYEYVDGHKGNYSETTAPIIYTLFVSKSKDIVHAIKVSNVNPQLIKKFFGKFVNEDTELKIKGGAKTFYEKIVSSVPIISNDSYRTYKLSGLGKITHINMDNTQLVPKNKLPKPQPQPAATFKNQPTNDSIVKEQ
jgi:hypothetical protein